MLGYSSAKGYVQLWAYGNTEREATNEWPLRWCLGWLLGSGSVGFYSQCFGQCDEETEEPP